MNFENGNHVGLKGLFLTSFKYAAMLAAILIITAIVLTTSAGQSIKIELVLLFSVMWLGIFWIGITLIRLSILCHKNISNVGWQRLLTILFCPSAPLVIWIAYEINYVRGALEHISVLTIAISLTHITVVGLYYLIKFLTSWIKDGFEKV